MKVDSFRYELPERLIAQTPSDERDQSRLMVLSRDRKEINTSVCFRDIADFLHEGDLLVLNNTRVVKARLYGRRSTGGKVEIFVTDPFKKKGTYEALVRSSRKIAPGERILLESGDSAEVLDSGEIGRKVRFSSDLDEILRSGHMPLPPYIKRPDRAEDGNRYQTVYANAPGATAAPTAGLHFTRRLLDDIRKKGVETAFITLHTGFGTFAPVKTENVQDHNMHSEYYRLEEDQAEKINRHRQRGGRIIAVGSTSVRVLETVADDEGYISPSEGETDLFIYPSYRFKAVDAMITNFHLPASTLLMMVCAFAGEDFMLDAYRKAVKEEYRFFSYGDAMFII